MASSLSIIFVILVACLPCSLFADSEAAVKLRQLLEKPLDYSQVKLTVDKLIDPSIDVEGTTVRLEAMSKSIIETFPSNATSMQKLSGLRTFLYKKGPWNKGETFEYDFSDPKGTNLKSKLLTNYLASKKGNCVSMPILFLILADRLGLDVSMSTAPEHYLIKYTDDIGPTFNVETTSGGNFSRDVWYQQQTPFSDEAIKTGIYLSKLTRKESAATLVTVLGEHYFETGEYEKSIEIFELVLEYFPKSVYAMLKIGSAHAKLISLGIREYQSSGQISKDKLEALKTHKLKNHHYFAKAESLGWREPVIQGNK